MIESNPVPDELPPGAPENAIEPTTIEFPGPLTLNRFVSLCVTILYLIIACFWGHPYLLAANMNGSGQVDQALPEISAPMANPPPANKHSANRNGPTPPQFGRVLFTLITLILPLGCIWYPELVANRGGFVQTGLGYTWDPEEAARARGESSPRIFIMIAGWILLLGIPLLMMLLSINVGA